MPTRHRRIAVVLDPELEDALAASSATTLAARVRELALLGAREARGGAQHRSDVQRSLDELGATPECGDLLLISRQLRRRGGAAPAESASDSLEWVRGER